MPNRVRIFLFILAMAGCGSGAAEASDPALSYCNPALDPAFALTHQDDAFNYYSGTRAIRGVVSQEAPGAPLTFDTRVNQACRFQITRTFGSQPASVLQDFQVEDAWESAPTCDSDQGQAALQGTYTLLVRGFKVPQAFLDRYDPQRILSGWEMSRYSFTLEYDSVQQVHRPSQVTCPQVVY